MVRKSKAKIVIKPFPASKLSSKDYSIVKFSKILKKNTKDFNARDMQRYLAWLNNKEHHTK